MRARVTGYITKVAFAAGALVKAGDLLFEIDPREYQAAVLRAEGDVARLRAQLARAESEVARNQSLRPSGAASARELERSIADKGAAEGDLKAKLAQFELARLDLEFTRVTAPVAGRVSRAEVTQGNLVVVGAYVACSVLTLLGGIMLMAQIGIGDPVQGVTYTLSSITAVVLGGAYAELGEWLLPTNVNRQLESTLGKADATLGNVNTNLSMLVQNLGRTLDNLANMTSNLNQQVQSNTNILAGISETVTHYDQFIQGLEHHWLLRSAFKGKSTNAPTIRPVQPLRSPKARSR